MDRADDKAAEARRAAQSLWDRERQRDTAEVQERVKARQADADKTTRLRDMRLAAERKAAAAGPAPRRRGAPKR